jgi:acyl-CoA thioester hydrolase
VSGVGPARRWAYSFPIQATLRDTDGLGHVNNAVYVTWLEEARTRYVAERRGFTDIHDVDFVLASTTIHFRSPVYFHEIVAVSLAPTRVGNKSWDLAYEGRAESDGRLVVEATTTQVQFDFRARISVPISAAWRRLLQADRVTP